MAATPRPTSCTRTNRENLLVTRHGLRSPHVETPSFRPTPRCTPFARIRAETLTIARTADPRAARRKISPATQPTTLWRRRRYHRRRHAKPEIPIDQPKRPAGSYLGGFRTPDGARKPYMGMVKRIAP